MDVHVNVFLKLQIISYFFGEHLVLMMSTDLVTLESI